MDVCIMQLLPFFTVPQAHERFHPGPRLSSNFKFFKIIVSDESFSMHVLLHLNLVCLAFLVITISTPESNSSPILPHRERLP
jgi:hypothetical protein